MSVQVPHFKVPLQIGRTGALQVLEQDTLDEIAQCVEVLLSTTEGQRLEVPDYGIPDPTFSVDLPLREIETKIADWEPRAAALLSEDESIEELVRTLKVQVGEG